VSVSEDTNRASHSIQGLSMLAQSSELSDLRKQLVRFEKAINRNQEMRMKYASDPKKCVAVPIRHLRCHS
jgi:Catenin-beta-like, Arm-motif containing nuclear